MKGRKIIIVGGIFLIVMLCALWRLMKEEKGVSTRMKEKTVRSQPLDMSAYADTQSGQTLQLLFIHHSCGGQLLAEPGSENGANGAHILTEGG
jgi:hypothetical protein